MNSMDISLKFLQTTATHPHTKIKPTDFYDTQISSSSNSEGCVHHLGSMSVGNSNLINYPI